MRIPVAGDVSTKDGLSNKNARLTNVLAEQKGEKTIAAVRPGLNQVAEGSGDGHNMVCFNNQLVNIFGADIKRATAIGGKTLNDPNTGDTSRVIFENFTGAYVDQFVITKGHPRYTSTYSPECLTSATDTLDDYVVMRLRFDGADGSTTITDDDGHTITNASSNQIKTDQYSCGASSLKMTGGGLSFSYSSDFDLGTDDFCIEFKVRFYDLTAFDFESDLNAFGVYDSTPNAGYRLALGASDEATVDTFSMILHGVEIVLQEAFSPLSDDTWYAFACSRDNGVIRIFKDGTLLDEIDTNDYTLTSIGTVTSGFFDFALMP